MKQNIIVLTIILFPLLISSHVFAAVNAVKATNLDPKSLQLLIAAQDGDLEVVKRLIGEKANIETKDDYGRTALHVAAENEQAEVATFLIEAGADLEARTDNALRVYWQSTPLMIAAQWGSTPLLLAVAQRNQTMVEFLINGGANVAKSDTNGLTPLHVIAQTDFVSLAELLITRGADINAKDKYSKFTPLDYAQDGELEMIQLLEQHGGICSSC